MQKHHWVKIPIYTLAIIFLLGSIPALAVESSSELPDLTGGLCRQWVSSLFSKAEGWSEPLRAQFIDYRLLPKKSLVLSRDEQKGVDIKTVIQKKPENRTLMLHLDQGSWGQQDLVIEGVLGLKSGIQGADNRTYLAALVDNAGKRQIIFIDPIHGLSPAVEVNKSEKIENLKPFNFYGLNVAKVENFGLTPSVTLYKFGGDTSSFSFNRTKDDNSPVEIVNNGDQYNLVYSASKGQQSIPLMTNTYDAKVSDNGATIDLKTNETSRQISTGFHPSTTQGIRMVSADNEGNSIYRDLNHEIVFFWASASENPSSTSRRLYWVYTNGTQPGSPGGLTPGGFTTIDAPIQYSMVFKDGYGKATVVGRGWDNTTILAHPLEKFDKSQVVQGWKPVLERGLIEGNKILVYSNDGISMMNIFSGKILKEPVPIQTLQMFREYNEVPDQYFSNVIQAPNGNHVIAFVRPNRGANSNKKLISNQIELYDLDTGSLLATKSVGEPSLKVHVRSLFQLTINDKEIGARLNLMNGKEPKDVTSAYVNFKLPPELKAK